ncbi:type II secretion system F family protein [Aidingimonas halophila]|uniref:Type II secretion system protein F (GspF) n=1 Tax=Aidingimonas halophila TaxID=574349 RepID=A0A1H3D593_9GAMM|nr:type II secretion system F family protein [Aidingimonas halophila]GHC30528.1 type II secretion system protein F [Aidingimonas halophila]SDX61480.1 type II secretion system protein F (GspF) [Aidingimonas halophila]
MNTATPARWRWTGIDASGQRISGERIATSRREVERDLHGRRILVKRIQRQRQWPGRGRITSRDTMLLARQLATLLHAGIPILQSLDTLAESVSKPPLVSLIRRLRHDIAAGSSVAEALYRHPDAIDRLFVNMVAAGEQSGTLDRMLERIATYKERIETLKGRVRKALYYPAAVILIGLVVTALLLVKVVPQFESLFRGVNAELPAMTQVTIALSEATQRYGGGCLAGLAAAGYLLRRRFLRSTRFAYRLQALTLKLPIIGDILDKAAMARFARTLATLYDAGVPLVDALATAAGASDNRVYDHAIERVRREVVTGRTLQAAMATTQRFPVLAVQMIGIGEDAGSLGTMLNRTAHYFEEEVENRVDALLSLLEPAIIVVLGILVGGLVVSMYLPIFELGNTL